jgi:hypothetical protein
MVPEESLAQYPRGGMGMPAFVQAFAKPTSEILSLLANLVLGSLQTNSYSARRENCWLTVTPVIAYIDGLACRKWLRMASAYPAA